jgi:uncharacterized membrane protein
MNAMTGNTPRLNPTPAPTPGEPNSRETNRQMKRLMLILIGSVVVLDGAIIGIYYALHIADRPVNTQESFIAVWVVLTLLLVSTLMRKIRKLRPRRRWSAGPPAER